MPSNLLSSVFGRSPIGPIQKHISKAHECAMELEPFFIAAFDGDWKKAESIQQKIVQLEHEADDMKRSVRLSLPNSLFLPVPRTDLLEIVTVQDKVANRAKDIAGIVLGRHMVIPPEIRTAFLNYLQRSIATSAQAVRAMDELDELVETGFKGREVNLVEQLIEELDRIESETDEHQVEVRKILFKLEKDLPPVDVIFTYKIIDWVGDLADRASRVGSHLQLLLAR
ncbi:phosphate transport regulator [Endozoicomonas montiporae]|uniref:Phosphate transport regulator n=2 Tax=Endozoicomonas montiporae TaxID=1027273 RepID=A0A081N2C0_9GAMM|nr:TIGR00153 family protein [Endozoicomonas montiporae]AMO58445.1 phosphate-specific transport system accessory protein PhoU-like [Endozoicomonas montiporae CL-33]KEQ12593.1 phosphate transport regulator [Endozoicomonas montiporae]